ncbi:Coiled-coil domain-containing protein 96 [Globomyces sp. JEL0801]|nr:Coiled-coil domain-containing protein 96 [Globomyces sp. JEL0801]
MSIPLFDILLSLKNENLLGPTNHPKKLSDSLDPWRLISNEYTDLDSKDPRWFELFMEYFIDAKHEVTDDILFFVRQYVPSHKSSTGSINDFDPVLVKRRIAGQIPQLADVIDWKQSFFLNLISQLPCTLTVSICTRSLELDKRKKWGSDSSEDIRQSTGDLSEPAKKNTMVAVKRVTKKVFAAPYKSRMDVKDAQMNECSYPLVYYTNNDFQEESLHLKIKPGEYLCAELSLTIPETKTSTEFINATEKVSQISLEDNSEPFPLPPNFSKITFFQGAVSFKALSDIYQQKGVAAANQSEPIEVEVSLVPNSEIPTEQEPVSEIQIENPNLEIPNEPIENEIVNAEDDTGFILGLETVLANLNEELIDFDKVYREESQTDLTQLISEQELEQSTDDTSFSVILFSDDNNQPKSVTSRLLESPKLGHIDVIVDNEINNVELEPLDLNMGLMMSRSASLESMTLETTDLLFASDDVEKSIPRPSSPSEIVVDLVVEPEQVEESEMENENPSVELGEGEIVLEHVAEEQIIDREAIIQAICKDIETRERLNARNVILQNKLAEHFKRKRQTDDTRDGEKSLTDQEQRYSLCMQSLSQLRAESDTVNVTNKKVVGEYEIKLEEKVKEVTDKAEQFWKYKRGVASTAENSRTGKPLPPKLIEQLEITERKKENEVVAVRLENIKLRNKLRRHEQLLRQKEELADGLHLIDFEQLKIENQTYNEKIEERNEELLKLRKKITNVVQVLTHVKEKLQFVQGEEIDLRSNLKNLEEEVAAKRDKLPAAKGIRDKLRATNTLLRQQNGLLGNEKLLMDYGDNVDDAQKLRDQINELQQTYTNLIDESVLIRRKIQKAQLIEKLNRGQMV